MPGAGHQIDQKMKRADMIRPIIAERQDGRMKQVVTVAWELITSLRANARR